MKKMSILSLAVGLFLVSAPLASSQNDAVVNMMYVIDFPKLSQYLELEPFQKYEIFQINDFFIDSQKQLLTGKLSPEKLEQKYHKVLYGNLKLMKEALTETQYRKYLRLINLTRGNRLFFPVENDDSEYLPVEAN